SAGVNRSCVVYLCVTLFTCFILSFFLFLFTDTATTEIYTLSLHDALPISQGAPAALINGLSILESFSIKQPSLGVTEISEIVGRSEEHTSELQSRFDLVCRLLLEKKK